MPTAQADQPDFSGFLRGREEKTKEIKDIISQRGKEISPIIERAKTEASNIPKPPELEPLPKEELKNPFADMFPALAAGIVFSTLLGGMSRVNFLQAMSGLAQGINAYHDGAIEKYQIEKDMALEKMKKALQENSLKIKDYELALEKHRGDMAALEQELKAIALKYDDPMMIARLDLEQYDKAIEWIIKQKEAQSKMLVNLNRLQIDAARLHEQKRHNVVMEGKRSNIVNDYQYYLSTLPAGQKPLSFLDFVKLYKPSISNLMPLDQGRPAGPATPPEGMKEITPDDLSGLAGALDTP